LARLAFAFDDERAVANAGLVLVSTLVDRLGIEQVIDETLDRQHCDLTREERAAEVVQGVESDPRSLVPLKRLHGAVRTCVGIAGQRRPNESVLVDTPWGT
jgi:hypothetical protein